MLDVPAVDESLQTPTPLPEADRMRWGNVQAGAFGSVSSAFGSVSDASPNHRTSAPRSRGAAGGRKPPCPSVTATAAQRFEPPRRSAGIP